MQETETTTDETTEDSAELPLPLDFTFDEAPRVAQARPFLTRYDQQVLSAFHRGSGS